MTPKSVLVTGSNQGLGFHCAAALVAGGHRVILACRNVSAANEAADKIAAGDASKRQQITVLDEACDLADLASVRKYAGAVVASLAGSKLDVLVLNAGLGGTPVYTITADGFDKIFESNHLGHFLLSLLVLPHLAKDARIVSVSSEVHDPAAKTGLPDPGIGFPASGDSAAWDALIAKGEPFPGDSDRTNGSPGEGALWGCPIGVNDEVAQAASKSPTNRACGLEHASTITSVAMNPGLMLDTGFVTAIGGKFLGYVAWALIPLLRWTPVGRLMRDATMSGQDLARLAVDEKFAGITAAFFDGNKQKPSSEFSREMESVVSRQVELWDRSMVWAKVSDEERRRAGL